MYVFAQNIGIRDKMKYYYQLIQYNNDLSFGSYKMELNRKLCAMRRKLSQRYWLDDSLGCCLLMWYCPFNFPFNFFNFFNFSNFFNFFNFQFYFRKFSNDNLRFYLVVQHCFSIFVTKLATLDNIIRRTKYEYVMYIHERNNWTNFRWDASEISISFSLNLCHSLAHPCHSFAEKT